MRRAVDWKGQPLPLLLRRRAERELRERQRREQRNRPSWPAVLLCLAAMLILLFNAIR